MKIVAKVKDSDVGFKKLKAALGKATGIAVLVGVRAKSGSDLAMIAAANEFGTGRIPSRSFLRDTLAINNARYTKLLARAVNGMLFLGVAPRTAMGLIGQVVVGDVQQRIRDRIAPPNAPYTIKRKGSDVPLIDTGRLRQSIDYELEIR